MCNYRAIQRMDDEPREVRQGEEYQAVSIPEIRPRPKKLEGEEAARLAAEPILQPGGCGPVGQPAPVHSHPLPQELHAFFGIRSMGTAGQPLSVLNALHIKQGLLTTGSSICSDRPVKAGRQ